MYCIRIFDFMKKVLHLVLKILGLKMGLCLAFRVFLEGCSLCIISIFIIVSDILRMLSISSILGYSLRGHSHLLSITYYSCVLTTSLYGFQQGSICLVVLPHLFWGCSWFFTIWLSLWSNPSYAELLIFNEFS